MVMRLVAQRVTERRITEKTASELGSEAAARRTALAIETTTHEVAS